MDNSKKILSSKAILAATALLGLGSQCALASITNDMIVKAWKSQKYLDSLSPEQQAMIPKNPAGSKLTQAEGFLVADYDTTQGGTGIGCTGIGCTGIGCTGIGCTGIGCDTHASCGEG